MGKFWEIKGQLPDYGRFWNFPPARTRASSCNMLILLDIKKQINQKFTICREVLPSDGRKS